MLAGNKAAIPKRQLYYNILVVQSKRRGLGARIPSLDTLAAIPTRIRASTRRTDRRDW